MYTEERDIKHIYTKPERTNEAIQNQNCQKNPKIPTQPQHKHHRPTVTKTLCPPTPNGCDESFSTRTVIVFPHPIPISIPYLFPLPANNFIFSPVAGLGPVPIFLGFVFVLGRFGLGLVEVVVVVEAEGLERLGRQRQANVWELDRVVVDLAIGLSRLWVVIKYVRFC
jgi:hypothetical protein